MTSSATELTCRQMSEFLADWLARELAPHERSVFEGHLAECPDCVAYLRSYANTIQLAKYAYADEQLPDDVPEGLVRAVLAARRRP